MLWLLLACINGATLTVDYEIETGNVCVVEDGEYRRIVVDDCIFPGEKGEPDLPALILRAALPIGTEASNIKLESCTWETLSGRYLIAPVTPIICTFPPRQPVPDPDPAIYSSSEFFPSDNLGSWMSDCFWGYPIAAVQIRPVQWNPEDGSVRILTSAKMIVEYESSGFLPVTQRTEWSERRASELVRGMVLNPEEVSSSGAALVTAGDLDYGQYVIITIPEYSEQFEELAAWKTGKGIPSEVYTTDQILSQYPGTDMPQSIRAFLTDCRTQGTDFVLIAGDHDVIPARYVGGNEYQDSFVTDLYFADNNDAYPGQDLWDSNRNGIWAESDDTVDWFPDMWVGRATVNTLEEAELFRNKVFLNEHHPSLYLPGNPDGMTMGYSTGFLQLGGVNFCGSQYAESLYSYIPGDWSELKCYESEGTNSTLLTIEMINSGPDQIFHLNHGGETEVYTSYGDLFSIDDLALLENITLSGKVPMLFSLSCLAGAFDTYTCFADAWLNSPEGGGFACMNSTFVHLSGTVPICHEFYRVFFHENIREPGITHGMALSVQCPSGGSMGNMVMCNNLFGDPESPMWRNPSSPLLVEHPLVITDSNQISVSVTHSNGTPADGARVCLQKGDWKNGEIYSVGLTDDSGNLVLPCDPLTLGEVVLTVTAEDCDPCIVTIPVTSVEYSPELHPTLTFNENPASGDIGVIFSTPSSASLKLSVYDMSGRIVSIPFFGTCNTGTYLRTLEGLTPGTYFLRYTSGQYEITEGFTIIE